MLFKISGRDFSNEAQPSSYEINKTNEFNEWQSADGQYHKDLFRTRIEGSFEMVFVSEDSESYLDFISYVNQHSEDNRITCDLYIGNTGEVETNISCYYTIKFKSRVNTNENIYVDRIEITLEER